MNVHACTYMNVHAQIHVYMYDVHVLISVFRLMIQREVNTVIKSAGQLWEPDIGTLN